MYQTRTAKLLKKEELAVIFLILLSSYIENNYNMGHKTISNWDERLIDQETSISLKPGLAIRL